MRATTKTEKRGWIRWRAVAVLAIGGALSLAYGGFFLDSHLRSLLEDFGTRQNGARVDIGSLHLSWWNQRLEMNGIQIAQTSQAMHNLLVFDHVTVDFDAGALLRNKLLIHDLRVEGVRHGTPRESSGEIIGNNGVPVATGPGLLDRSSVAPYPVLLNRYPENPLGRLARFSMGLGLQNKFDERRVHMRSVVTLLALRHDLDTGRAHWHQFAAQLPGSAWIEERRHRLREPARVLASTAPNPRTQTEQEVRTLRDKLKAEATRYAESANKLQHQLKEVSGMIDADLKDLRATLGLPSLDATDLTPLLFGPRLTGYFGRLGYWIDLARRRMPNGTRQGLVFSGAASGQDIHFAKMSTMPAMLIEKATIVSDLEKEPGGGHVRGGAEGITSDPPILRKNAHIWLDADFPSTHINNLHFSVELDHAGESATEALEFGVDAVPVHHWALHNGSDLGLFIENGIARGSFHGEFHGAQTNARWHAQVRGAEYSVTTPYQELADRLGDILRPQTDVDVDGTLSGEGDKAKLTLTSNLGKALAAALPTVFKNPLGAVDDSIRKFILDEVDEPRQRLSEQATQWRNEIDEKTTPLLHELDSLLAT